MAYLRLQLLLVLLLLSAATVIHASGPHGAGHGRRLGEWPVARPPSGSARAARPVGPPRGTPAARKRFRCVKRCQHTPTCRCHQDQASPSASST